MINVIIFINMNNICIYPYLCLEYFIYSPSSQNCLYFLFVTLYTNREQEPLVFGDDVDQQRQLQLSLIITRMLKPVDVYVYNVYIIISIILLLQTGREDVRTKIAV